MSENETKHDIMLKRAQLVIGVLAGITTLIIGVYNVRNIFVKKPEPVKVAEPAKKADPIRDALEEAGASWIKKVASAKSG